MHVDLPTNPSIRTMKKDMNIIWKTLVLLILLPSWHSAQAFSTHYHPRPVFTSSASFGTISFKNHPYKQQFSSKTTLYASRWGIRSKLKSFANRIFSKQRVRQKQQRQRQGKLEEEYKDKENNQKNHNRTSTSIDDTKVSITLDVNDDTTTQQTTSSSEPSLSSSPDTTTTRSTTTTAVDLSGNWTLLVNETFLQEYQQYLTQLGQPFWVRSIALSIVGRTTEKTKQTQEGASLWIQGTNVRGTWERTLMTTAPNSTLLTADGEEVQSVAWWEGPVHVSWLHGVQKYGGGSFESRRYLNPDGYLLCESTFHPLDPNRESAHVTWIFVPEQEK